MEKLQVERLRGWSHFLKSGEFYVETTGNFYNEQNLSMFRKIIT